MTRSARYQWPTDAMTRRGHDKDVDRLERLFQAHKLRIRQLETLVEEIMTLKVFRK